MCGYAKDPSTELVAKTTKRNGIDSCLPKAKKICLAPSALGEPYSTSLHPSIVCSETLKVLYTGTDFVGW